MKYAVYLVVGGWMFFLGVLVGRDTMPFNFDTSGFQARLKRIALDEAPASAPEVHKVTLDIDAFTSAKAPDSFPLVKPRASTPAAFRPEEGGMIRRATGLKPKPAVVKQVLSASPVDTAAPDKKALKKTPPPKKVAQKAAKSVAKPSGGHYTIQVAAFNQEGDARKEKARLVNKGFDVQVVQGTKNKVTWYRVRVGNYPSRDAAGRGLIKLRKAGIRKGLIIKKD